VGLGGFKLFRRFSDASPGTVSSTYPKFRRVDMYRKLEALGTALFGIFSSRIGTAAPCTHR
jgi:hypothetical protein